MFEDFFTAKNIDIMKGIEIAMTLEKKGKKYYLDKAKRIEDKNIKIFLEFLAKEEAHHYELLSEVKNSLKKQGKWISIPASKLKSKVKRPHVFTKKSEPKRKSDQINVILSSMKVEKDVEEFYRRMADSIKDIDGKKFFLALADFELSHYNLLDGILESLTYNRIES